MKNAAAPYKWEQTQIQSTQAEYFFDLKLQEIANQYREYLTQLYEVQQLPNIDDCERQSRSLSFRHAAILNNIFQNHSKEAEQNKEFMLQMWYAKTIFNFLKIWFMETQRTNISVQQQMFDWLTSIQTEDHQQTTWQHQMLDKLSNRLYEEAAKIVHDNQQNRGLESIIKQTSFHYFPVISKDLSNAEEERVRTKESLERVKTEENAQLILALQGNRQSLMDICGTDWKLYLRLCLLLGPKPDLTARDLSNALDTCRNINQTNQFDVFIFRIIRNPDVLTVLVEIKNVQMAWLAYIGFRLLLPFRIFNIDREQLQKYERHLQKELLDRLSESRYSFETYFWFAEEYRKKNQEEVDEVRDTLIPKLRSAREFKVVQQRVEQCLNSAACVDVGLLVLQSHVIDSFQQADPLLTINVLMNIYNRLRQDGGGWQISPILQFYQSYVKSNPQDRRHPNGQKLWNFYQNYKLWFKIFLKFDYLQIDMELSKYDQENFNQTLLKPLICIAQLKQTLDPNALLAYSEIIWQKLELSETKIHQKLHLKFFDVLEKNAHQILPKLNNETRLNLKSKLCSLLQTINPDQQIHRELILNI